MIKKLESYATECKYIADHHLFDGKGIYFGPGADSIPLLFAHKKGHMTGFTFRRWDVLSMARTLELIGKYPDDVFGEYLGPDEYNEQLEYWENYTQALGDMRNQGSIESALKDEKFDYLILKGVREFVYNADNGSFEAFVRHVHKHYTKPGSVFIVSFAPNCDMTYDGEIDSLLTETLGYLDLTNNPPFLDCVPMEENFGDYEIPDVFGPPETTDLGVPELKGLTGFNSLIPIGNFGFFQRQI